MLVDRVFGDAGATVVLEDRIDGEEASVHGITDGERLLVLPAARDHKRVFDGDRGPNTGGMGVVAPAPRVSSNSSRASSVTSSAQTIDGMRADGAPFHGVLFAGLMVTPRGEPMLLEHNVRFGDPECEALVALLDGDLGELLAGAAAGALDASCVRVAEDRHATVVVLAAPGYPEAPRKGDVIDGIDRAEQLGGVLVHHAGTAEQGRRDRHVRRPRVLAVTAVGQTRGRVTRPRLRGRRAGSTSKRRALPARHRRTLNRGSVGRDHDPTRDQNGMSSSLPPS